MRSILIAGVAALTLAAPLLAQPSKGNGGGNKDSGSPSAKPERVKGDGGGQAKRAEGGQAKRAERQQGRAPERKEARIDRQQSRGKPQRELRVERADGGDRREARGQQQREERNAVVRVQDARGQANAAFRRVDFDRRGDVFASPAFRSTGLIDGCPPGLAAKNNGCLPPGQAKKLLGGAVPATLGAAMLPSLYRSWYPDNDDHFYRTEGDYVYRIDRDRNLVDGFFPLYDDYSGAYYVGAAYPQDYLGTYNVPVQYQPWYADNGDDFYRYGDGAIYRVNRNGGVIEGIVSLLTGDLALGQQLPSGYDAYNVPYDYRDRYADSDDALYRYNDGRIFQVDPTTRMVQAIVETLI